MQNLRPALDAIGPTLGAVSFALAHMMVRLSLASQSFAAAHEHMLALGLPSVCEETLRKLVLAEGVAAGEALDQQAIDPGFVAQGCPNAARDGSAVVLGMDGVKIPTNTDEEKLKRRRKVVAKRGVRGRRGLPPLPKLPPRRRGSDQRWKEAKVVGVYDLHHKHAFWRATTGDHHEAARLAGLIARKVRFDRADERLAATDGAIWIEHRLAEAHLKLELHAHILDFYHFAQHVHAAADALHERGSESQAWAHHMKTLAKKQGPDALIAALKAHTPNHEAGRIALDQLLGYLEPRRHMIDYPTYLARGWPIGSGPTESTCKGATRFIKGPGKRWDLDNAEAMMNLETLAMDGHLEAFFDHRRNKAA